MLPNFRLMIAALFVSVVALICGFGVFAAFRVSHEPLARVAPGTAALKLVAADAPAPSVEAIEPFAQRFHFGEAGGDGGVAALAYSSAPPNEPPIVKLRLPITEARDGSAANVPAAPADSADAPAPQAPQPQVVEVSLGSEPDDASAANTPQSPQEAPQQTVEAPLQTPQEPSQESPQSAKSDDVARQTAADSPAAGPAGDETEGAESAAEAPDVAAIEPASAESSTVEAPRVEQTSDVDRAPDAIAAPAPDPEPAAKAVEKKVVHKAHAHAATPSVKRKPAYTETSFQTAPSWPQQQSAQNQHAKGASKTGGQSDFGTGGPFVSPSGR